MASLELERIRTIVVTGGAGFIGSHVVDDLLKACPNARLRVVDAFTYAADVSNLDAAFRTGRVALTKGDIGNLDLMSGLLRDADLVVHAAGESHVERSFAAPERFSLSNAIGTQVLMEAMARQKVPLMVHVSSAEVYGLPGEQPVSELSPLDPQNPLAASKAAAEMLIAGLGRTRGLDIRILRPVNVIGTRQNTEKLLPRFLELAAVGRPLPVHGDGGQRRSFLAIPDFCSALRTVVTRGAANGTYNLAGPDRHSVAEVARMVLDTVPDTVAGVIFVEGRCADAGHPPVDASAARALGWEAGATLRQMLPQLAAWYGARIPDFRSRRVLRHVPDLAPGAGAVARPEGSGLFRSLERH
ncbi:MAG: GDP-mannose 4,6-dehydratase [Shinella sp.]|nr:GDP-mannose 4,6-dehydratase [Shinella sp.]